jgi:formate hydrogenlyase subunit 6/NADH:ubiquinone oxidoreductase subunit I
VNFVVRDGKFDVVIAAGPRVENWPSAGVRALSVLCADMGLTVGQFGGEALNVRGVIPLPGIGGLVLLEDIQKRIHRIHARAIIRITPESFIPDPFPGWYSPGLIPISTAERLQRESQITWDPATVILGTGNRALSFGSRLLESGVAEVFCIESYAQWGAKRFAGWEVERRHFEMLGGKLIEAKPIQLTQKAALLWQLRLQDSLGIRVLEVGRVISAGPFRELPSIREYPPGSCLFELEQTAAGTQAENVEGWVLEEERGKWLACKIVKTLVNDLGPKREELDRIFRRARGRLKRYFKHREDPFTPSYQGKWIAISDSKRMRSFRGVPQEAHHSRLVASVECFEEIPCNICQTVCPTSAIQIGRVPRNKNTILSEADCNQCGLCVSACPTRSIPLIHERENRSTSQIVLPWNGVKPWAIGEFATLLNRRGDSLGSGRVVGILETKQEEKTQLVQVEVPTHLTWEARALKKLKLPESSDEAYFTAIARASSTSEKVEITLNGEKRLVRDRIPVSIALFEIGQNRREDSLFCRDGTCGLCMISVDSVNKYACQTRVHRGMAIRIPDGTPVKPEPNALCPCLKITQEQVVERLKHGKLQSTEAVVSVTQIGEGKCHGQLCMGPLRRVLLDQGLAAENWIDWRFPWSDWLLTHN